MTLSPATRDDRRPTLGSVLTAAGGLVLFIYFIRRAGIGDLTAGISRLGWVFVIVVALGGLRFLVRAAAWMRCMEGSHRLGLGEVFQAVIAGDALGNLTPLSLIVSEPAKAMFLRHREPLRRTLPALAVENLFYTLSALVVIAGGLVALLLVLQTPGQLWLATAVLFLTLVTFIVIAHWVIWNHLPIGSATLAWLRRHGIAPAWTARAEPRVREVEDRIHALYPRDWSRLLPVATLELLFHLFAILEIFLVLSLISGQQPTILDAFVFESTNRFIAVVFKFVPLRIGVDEAGTGMFAELLAFGTVTGVTLAIVRKGRMLVWMALGIATLVRRGLSVRGALGSATSDVALVVMGRSPRGAQAPKTRLSEAIVDESDRRRLYAAFLQDTVDACRAVDGTTMRLAYTRDGGTAGFRELGISEDELLPQRGADLGAREREIFADLFEAGFEKVVMIGSDLPTLPVSHIRQAIDRIEAKTVVLGPSEDGGYYLMALAAPGPGAQIPDLFTDIRWSTSSTLDDTRAAVARAGFRVEVVPHWYDVDDVEGLRRLRSELDDEAGRNRAPATARVLGEIARQKTE